MARSLPFPLATHVIVATDTLPPYKVPGTHTVELVKIVMTSGDGEETTTASESRDCLSPRSLVVLVENELLQVVGAHLVALAAEERGDVLAVPV